MKRAWRLSATPTHTLFLCAAVALAGACSEERKPAAPTPTPTALAPPAKEPAETFSLVLQDRYGHAKLVAKGIAGASIESYFDKGQPTLRFSGFPLGTRWSMAGKSGELKREVWETFVVGDATALGALVVDDKLATRSVASSDDLTVELPSGAKTTVRALPTYVGGAVAEALREVAAGPVVFGAEPPDDPALRAIAVPDGANVTIVGDRVSVNQIDKVALYQRVPEITGTVVCKGYLSGPKSGITMNLRGVEVVLYDRRAGHELARRTFPGSKRCPKTVYLRPDQTSIDSVWDDDAVRGWLRPQLR